jgi:hypothetical protein
VYGPPKDLLGHLSAFEVRFADVLAAFVGAPAESDLMAADPRTFNDDQAAIRKDWPLTQVMDEFLAAHDRVMRHRQGDLRRRRGARSARSLGTAAEYSLDDLVVYQMYGHKREHDPQLSAVLEQR